jgi:hypothetical protein
VQHTIRREFPGARPRLSILAGSRPEDKALLHVTVQAGFDPVSLTRESKRMALRVASLVKKDYPLEGFSRIQVQVRQGGNAASAAKRRTYIFPLGATKLAVSQPAARPLSRGSAIARRSAGPPP